MARGKVIPTRTTAPIHIHWKAITTYKALYRDKRGNEITVRSIREPPKTKVLRASTGRRKYYLKRLTTNKREVIVLAKTKNRSKKVDQEELEEVEAIEELEELEDDDEDEEEPDEVEDDDDEDEDEEPAPKKSKKSKSKAKSNGRQPPPDRPLPDGMVGTAEVAEHFGIDGRSLRMLLRRHSIPKDEDTGRYAWSSLNHKQVVKIGKLIAKGEHKAAQKEQLDALKERKASEKAEKTKSSKKKGAKKSKKRPVEDDEDDDE